MTSKYKRWIVAALPLAMACSINAQGKVTDVSTRMVAGGLAIHIGGNELTRPSVHWVDGALHLEFDGTALEATPSTKRPNSGGIKAYSFAKNGKNVRVAVRPNGSTLHQLVKVEDGWLVFFESPLPWKAPAKLAQHKPTYAPVNPRDFKPKSLVTLNFVDTDIVQILKALAMQGNVNVAMGPDVTGKVTINLDNVPVEDAMDLVTTLGGVRYAYVNNTYVVASNAKFAEAMESISKRSNLVSETRVVPLFSREGTQLKAAILKMVPPSTVDGKYELVLPSEKVSVEQKQAVTPPTTGQDEKAGGSTQTNTTVKSESASDANKKDDYIVLVGTPSRMDTVEKAVRSLDAQICSALGIKVGDTQGIIQKTYEPRGLLAQDLVKAVLGDAKEIDGVKMVATPGASASRQAIVLSGRAWDVDRVIAMLSNVDSEQDAGDTFFEMVELKHVRPNYVWSQLTQNIPGLRASFLPPPVDPRIAIDFKEEGSTAPGGSGGSGIAGNNSGGAGAASGPQSEGNGGGSGGSLGSGGQANTNISTSTKANTFPMKLFLRGSRAQIDAAKEYLAMVDVAPKQVAVELRVMELTRDDALKVGLDWSILTGGTLQSIRVNNALGSPSAAGGVSADLGFRGGGTASILGALDAIATRNNVLARPSILANDGVPTNIFVGDEVRYVKSITNSNNGGLQVVTDQIDVGVDFNVTARVGADGNILLDLAPTLKVLQGFTDVPGGGQLPQTSRRSAQTQMSIRSGETIAIGGLIQDQDRKVHGGIPILKDLPLIGHLFGRTSTSKVRSEIVFFVTVREVTEADRQGAANPRQAERDNTQWPGNKDGKKGG